MPLNVIWWCPVTKIGIFVGQKCQKLHNIFISVVPSASKINLGSPMNKICTFCKPKMPKIATTTTKHAILFCPKCPPKHLGSLMIEICLYLGDKVSTPCCYQYSSLYTHLFVLQRIIGFREGSSSYSWFHKYN